MSEANAECACDIHAPRTNPFADQYAPFFSIVGSAGLPFTEAAFLTGGATHGSSLSSAPGSRSKISQ